MDGDPFQWVSKVAKDSIMETVTKHVSIMPVRGLPSACMAPTVQFSQKILMSAQYFWQQLVSMWELTRDGGLLLYIL